MAKDFPKLIDVDDSMLLVIDVQDVFLAKLAPAMAEQVVERIRWLIQVAEWFTVPIVLTAEDVPKHGATTVRIKDVIPAETPELNKVIFGLAQQPDILQVVQCLGRKTAVLVGLETDVCVQHSAFGLMQLGYTVVAVVDATASPESGHELGLARMRDAGVVMVSAKGLFYEWSRDIVKIGEILQSNRIDRPKGLLL
jgi:nicotinamidase-related amidase